MGIECVFVCARVCVLNEMNNKHRQLQFDFEPNQTVRKKKKKQTQIL